MKVLFQTQDPDAAQLRKIATQRLRFALRRLTWLVPRAKLKLSDINGPDGGVDKRCQLELKTDFAKPVVITSIARDWGDALNQSLVRAARVVVRQWRLRQAHQDQKSAARPPVPRTLRRSRALSAG